MTSDSCKVDISSIKPHTTFLELEFDSLDFIDLLLNVEAHYDISIPEEEMKRLWSISLLADCVLEKLS